MCRVELRRPSAIYMFLIIDSLICGIVHNYIMYLYMSMGFYEVI